MFITLLSGMAGWPLAALGQQTAKPVIGFLSLTTPGAFPHILMAFHQGLKEAGYVEGLNAAVEYRWGEGQYDRLPALAIELVARRASVIVAVGNSTSALAAKAATTTIPIVFVVGIDPVQIGLVQSLSRPGANITGVTLYTAELAAKRLQLVRELTPTASVIALLINPTNPNNSARQISEAHDAGANTRQRLLILRPSSETDLDVAFASLAHEGAGAVLIDSDAFFAQQRERLVALAARHKIPTIYDRREYAAAGGLVSYGTDFVNVYRQAGAYTGRVLKGEKSADLPVMQPTKFDLVINLKTAKALGLTVPDSLLTRADEVIE